MSARCETAGRAGAAALAALAAALMLPPVPAAAHAALVDAGTVPAIALHARYDTGEPMAQAQVVIYAPDDPAAVWRRGQTDGAGRFDFVPDPALPGRWTVQVRQAGHGATVHVETGGTAPAVAASGAAPSVLQRAVMAALVAWGALGTALYFRRAKRQKNASS